MWLAARRLHRDGEQACDDLVLASGSRASDYATHLLELVRFWRARLWPALGLVSMARASGFERRIRALLDRTRDRRAATRQVVVVALVVALGTLAPVAALEPAVARPIEPAHAMPLPPEAWAEIQDVVHAAPARASITPTGTEQDGVTVTGAVLDPTGEPVANVALVLLGRGRTLRGRTDAAGRFAFDTAPRGLATLRVMPTGFAPMVASLDVRPGMAPVTVDLEAGRLLRGRVVGADGEGLAGVEVNAVAWRESLYMRWRATTDADGRFQWSNAPDDAVAFGFWKDGYRPQAEKLVALEGEQIVRLRPTMAVRGHVVDAETGEPIEAFKVIRGLEPATLPGMIAWQNARARDFADGQYVVRISDSLPLPDQRGRTFHRVRIEADGYQPAVSERLSGDADAVELNFRLVKNAS